MDIQRFTVKSQEALQEAQTKAVRYNHLEVDGEHLLLALLEQSEGLVPRLLMRMEVPVDQLKARLEQELDRRPRVSGPGAEPGKVYLTQRLSRLLVRAEDEPVASKTNTSLWNTYSWPWPRRGTPRLRAGFLRLLESPETPFLGS